MHAVRTLGALSVATLAADIRLLLPCNVVCVKRQKVAFWLAAWTRSSRCR